MYLPLLQYRNARDFSLLILHPLTLLYSLIPSSNFLVASLEFSLYIIVLSSNCENFTYFPVWILFFSSSLIAVAKTSKTMLNNHGKSGHPCLIPHLRGNAFTFSLLRAMLAMALSYKSFIMLGSLVAQTVKPLPTMWETSV